MDSDRRCLSSIDGGNELKLPFGYRFDPTDVEVVEYYLLPKLKGEMLPSNYVVDLDIYKVDPHQLLPHDGLNHVKENQAFFFVENIRNNSVQQVRTTPSGYWKVYEEKAPVYRSNDTTIGFKTKLLFHDSDGNETDWKMSEYECDPTQVSASSLKSFVVCKVKQRMKIKMEDDIEIVNEESENGIDGGQHRLDPT